MKKIFFILLSLLFIGSNAFAGKAYSISFTQIVEHPLLDAIRDGVLERLKEKGVNVKANVHIAQGNPTKNAQIISQIMGEQPDLVVAIATPGAQIAAQKIKNRPVLFTGVTDPVSLGLVKDLKNTNGKNITGMSDFSPMDKHVALIKEIVPTVKFIGVIYNGGDPNSYVLIKKFKEEASTAGLSVEEEKVVNSTGVYKAAKNLIGRCDVIYIPTDNTVISALESAIKVCKQNRLPLIVGDVGSVERGAIAAVIVDYYKIGLQTGDMAYKILVDGTDPGSMPIEFLNDLDLHLNKKAAVSMHVTLSESILKRATRVIE